MIINEYIWNTVTAELMQGYLLKKDTDELICLICGMHFMKGVVYPHQDLLLEAEKSIQRHIRDKHSSVFDYLINLDKKYTGISGNQKEMLQFFYQGITDKEIQKKLQGISLSTIRNYRFFLKEKEKQARIFLAIMGLVKTKDQQDDQHFIPIPGSSVLHDERFAITEEENAKVIREHFPEGEDGAMLRFPKKEKRKIIVLLHLLKRFTAGRIYSEKEVNAVLKDVYEDYALLRRYLIEYGFMERKADGSQYWVKE